MKPQVFMTMRWAQKTASQAGRPPSGGGEGGCEAWEGGRERMRERMVVRGLTGEWVSVVLGGCGPGVSSSVSVSVSEAESRPGSRGVPFFFSSFWSSGIVGGVCCRMDSSDRTPFSTSTSTSPSPSMCRGGGSMVLWLRVCGVVV